MGKAHLYKGIKDIKILDIIKTNPTRAVCQITFQD